MTEESNILDWDDLTPEDQARAESLLEELNNMFKRYNKKEDLPCDDSTSTD